MSLTTKPSTRVAAFLGAVLGLVFVGFWLLNGLRILLTADVTLEPEYLMKDYWLLPVGADAYAVIKGENAEGIVVMDEISEVEWNDRFIVAQGHSAGSSKRVYYLVDIRSDEDYRRYVLSSKGGLELQRQKLGVPLTLPNIRGWQH